MSEPVSGDLILITLTWKGKRSSGVCNDCQALLGPVPINRGVFGSIDVR
jgi:hypothetical protein